jgi:hypothetical protein
MIEDWMNDLAHRLAEAERRPRRPWKTCHVCGDAYSLEAFEALPFASRLETPNGCDPKGGMGGLYFKKCLTESCQGIMSDDAMVMAMAAVR